MNMSTVSMSGRGCVALGGEDKDVTEEERMFVAGGRRTVPQKGVVFVKFQLFPKCFFSVCMIILGYCTHVFSIRTFYISIYEQNRDISNFLVAKNCQNCDIFLEPSSIFSRCFITTNLVVLYNIGSKLRKNNAKVDQSSI